MDNLQLQGFFGDVGHALILGRTGAGMSSLVAFLRCVNRQNRAILSPVRQAKITMENNTATILQDKPDEKIATATLCLGQTKLVVLEDRLIVESPGVYWFCDTFRPDSVYAMIDRNWLVLCDGPVGELAISMADQSVEAVQTFFLTQGVGVENLEAKEFHHAVRSGDKSPPRSGPIG